MFESQKMMKELPWLLSESKKSTVGTLVGWRAPEGRVYGVVVGSQGKYLLCMSIHDATLKDDSVLKLYRDKNLSEKLAPIMTGIQASIHRVPVSKAFKRGLVKAAALKPYIQVAAQLQLEGKVEEGMNIALVNEKLEMIWKTLELDERFVRLPRGAAKSKAHRAFLKMVRKDPAAHRRKMKMDKAYHRKHKAHDELMRRTAKKGYIRR